MISDHQLRSAYLDEPTIAYFRRKLTDVPEAELQRRVEETIKFLIIATECTGAIPVTREIDQIWHLWILQTQEYVKLCQLLPAGEFIHHSSNDYLAFFDPSVDEGTDLAGDVKMLALYVQNFGPFDSDRAKYWRLATHVVDDLGWSLQQLNEWLLIPDPTGDQ